MSQRTAQLGLLTETAPHTLMGRLLRSFWQPVALADSVAKGMARPLRILEEDLTLYRGDSGRAYLVGGRCAHRCTTLHTGWVRGEELQCMYHGWRYDGTGLCTDIPAEKGTRSTPVRIAGYPVHQYCGVLFAYFGDGPAPAFDLPRKDVLEQSDRTVFTQLQIWDCNWFQQVENSLDAVHVSFVHVWGKVGRFGEAVTTVLPALSYQETSAGIRQTATRSRANVRISDWTFPNNNHIIVPGGEKDDPWTHISVWAVPIDDEHTARFTMYAVAATDPDRIARIKAEHELDYNPADHYDDLFERHQVSEIGEAAMTTTQDYMAVRGQGKIVDRTRENLSASDAGIALLRRIFLRELEAIDSGKPTKAWSRLEHAADLPVPSQAAG
jgi:5,5'-dehydrodivanillate O-demethylase oxygenase subunit